MSSIGTISRKRRSLCILAALPPLLVASACSSNEPVGHRADPIWNGTTPAALPNAAHVVVAQGKTLGSGVALNNRWVVT